VANETAKRLIARVRELRKARNLTQEQFAERGGFDYKYYQHLEAGRRPNMTLPTLEKLARACGLELWDLLNFQSEPAIAAEPDAEGQSKPVHRRPRKRP
jgi:transcriptional regulator with XRE-family HTH domain